MHLIVNTVDGAPSYYAPDAARRFGTPHFWTPDKAKALQFARPEDAQAFLGTFLPHDAPSCQVVAG
jgi:hypothetical protein